MASKDLTGKHTAEDGTVVDFDGFYTVAGESRIAYYLLGWDTQEIPESYDLDCGSETHIFDPGTWDGPDGDRVHGEACYLYSEPEEIDRTDQVRAVMVGDDRVHVVDVADLVIIGDDDYCPGCGAVPSCYGPAE